MIYTLVTEDGLEESFDSEFALVYRVFGILGCDTSQTDMQGQGQIVIYTGVWKHSDGRYYLRPE